MILVFHSVSARPDGAAAISVTQTIDCTTRQISTRYAAFGDNGELLRDAAAMPDAVAIAIGVENWAENLQSSCETLRKRSQCYARGALCPRKLPR